MTSHAMTNNERRMTRGFAPERGASSVIRHSSSVIFSQPASFRRRLRNAVAFSFICLLLIAGKFAPALLHAEEAADRATILIVTGAGGEDQYADTFAKWAADWRRACDAAGAKSISVGRDKNAGSDRERLKAALEAEPKDGANDLWLVLIGHGTADAKDAKFNLRGDDISVSEIAAWLKPFTRPVVVVCSFSASGAWLKPLSSPGRVVVAATKSGSENNYARFGGHLAQAIADPAADMDKDCETSLLEAWLTAARKTADFYKDEGRLATEHSLLDDNGDGLGTPADWFSGVRAVKKAKDGTLPDGLRAAQVHLVRSSEERALSPERRAERDALERELAALRERKAAMKEGDYFRELEALLLKIARIYKAGT